MYAFNVVETFSIQQFNINFGMKCLIIFCSYCKVYIFYVLMICDELKELSSTSFCKVYIFYVLMICDELNELSSTGYYEV